MRADGTIIIDTAIKTDGMVPGTKEVEASVRRMANSVTDLGKKSEIALQKQAAAFAKMNSAYAEQERKVKDLQHQVEEYGSTKIPTKEYIDIQNQITAAEKKLAQLAERQEKFLNTGGKTNSSTYKKMQYDIEELANTIKYAKGELASLEASGGAFILGKDTDKFSELSDKYTKESLKLSQMNETLGASYSRVKNEFTQYKKRLLGVDGANKKADKSGRKLNKTLKGTKKSAKGAQMSLGKMLLTSMMFSAVFRAISLVTSGLKEGMDNLALYSDDTNAALSLLMSSLTQLKNAFATAFDPLLQVAAPAMGKFISLLAEAVTWTSQFFAALTGKDTYTKAVKVEEDYADSIRDSNEALKEKDKTNKKVLYSFDQLIQAQNKDTDSGKYTGPTPDQMFETEQVSNEAKTQAEAVKKTFKDLFTPLKESWMENGPVVMESLKNLFTAAKQLAKDVGASFMQVWNVEGYGKAITDDLLTTFANLVQTVANLIIQFDKAWTSGDVGTRIMRHLGDIILEITGFFRSASESLKNWAAELDFTPLLESFNRVLIALEPIVGDIGDALLWLLDEVLLPIAKWGVEQALPAAFDLIAGALKVLHSVIVALKPLGLWLWENFLKPLGQWVADLFISTLNKIADGLEKFSGWINDNQEIVRAGAVAVAGFFGAWKTVELLSFIQQSGGVIGALKNITNALAGSTLAKIKDKAETAYLSVLYAKDFVVSIGATITKLLAQAAAFVKTTAAKWADVAAQKAVTLATQAWRGVCTLSKIATDFFATSMGVLALKIGAVVAVFVTIQKLASYVAQAWDKMTPEEQLATKIIAVAGAIALVVALIAGAMKDITTLMIAGSVAAIAGFSLAGIAYGANQRSSSGRNRGSSQYTGYTPAYAAVPYRMPRLATGTVVPPRAGEFAAILGDNNRETEIVSPLSTMKQAFKEAIAETGMNGGGRDINIELIVDGQRFARAVYKANNQEKQRVGLRMVNV